ncbi:MAG: hypothetical protein ACTSWQ_09180 [Candidatus Thorarchaeota archaeon]
MLKSKKISFNQQTYGSIFKLIKYLGYMVKVRTAVEIEEVVQVYNPPSRVIISPMFFRQFDCKCCGRCCTKPKFSLAYSVADFMRACAQPLDDPKEIKARNALVEAVQNVNVLVKTGKEGKERTYKTHFILYSNHGHQCDFIFEDQGRRYCRIHKFHPNHCLLPHIQIDQLKSTSTSLLKRQYGRNWNLGCESVPSPFDYDKFVVWDLPCLKRLVHNAEELKMVTWLPEVVDWFTENVERLRSWQPTTPVVIYDRKRGIPGNFLL